MQLMAKSEKDGMVDFSSKPLHASDGLRRGWNSGLFLKSVPRSLWPKERWMEWWPFPSMRSMQLMGKSEENGMVAFFSNPLHASDG